MKFSAALTSLDSGLVELIAGDPEVAEAELRRDYEELDRMGESNYRATIAAFLAEALYRQERLEDAEKFAGICREIAAADDLVSQIYWRSVLGRVLARRGEFDRGRILLLEAHEMIRPSDELDSKGKILAEFMRWMLTEGQKLTADLSYAPLPKGIIDMEMAAIDKVK
jgi:ATP/maltotriose-dependent transcriptional regulator MalT